MFKIPPESLEEMQHILVSDICTFFGREKERVVEYQFSPGPVQPSSTLRFPLTSHTRFILKLKQLSKKCFCTYLSWNYTQFLNADKDTVKLVPRPTVKSNLEMHDCILPMRLVPLSSYFLCFRTFSWLGRLGNICNVPNIYRR